MTKSKLITIATEINEAYDWLYFARMGLRHYSIAVAQGYVKHAEKSIKKVEKLIER